MASFSSGSSNFALAGGLCSLAMASRPVCLGRRLGSRRFPSLFSTGVTVTHKMQIIRTKKHVAGSNARTG